MFDDSTLICLDLFSFLGQLSRKVVQNVHLSGGSLLGVSRGGPTVSEIVDSMKVSFNLSLTRYFIVFP